WHLSEGDDHSLVALLIYGDLIHVHVHLAGAGSAVDATGGHAELGGLVDHYVDLAVEVALAVARTVVIGVEDGVAAIILDDDIIDVLSLPRKGDALAAGNARLRNIKFAARGLLLFSFLFGLHAHGTSVGT